MKIIIIIWYILFMFFSLSAQPMPSEFFTGGSTQVQDNKNTSKRIVVDNFDRQNPLTVYRVLEENESQLEIFASPIAHSGVNSMKLDYILSTSGLSPSKVRVVWYGKNSPLNWKTGDKLSVWIKGDGTGNVFKILLIDSDDERWIYSDEEILKRSEWQQLKMSLMNFKKLSEKGNDRLDLNSIKQIELIVEGRDHISSHGEVYFDDLVLQGGSLDSSIGSFPDISYAPQALAIGLMNVKFNLLGVALARSTQKDGATMTSWLHTDIIGNVRNAIVESRLTVGDVNYGAGAVNGPLPERKHYKKDYQVKGGYIKFSLLYLTPFISKLSMGNLKVDYSKYSYSQYHTSEEDPQYKGLSLEGGISFLDYHTFFIKHWGDAGTVGSSLIMNYKGYTLRGIYVGSQNKARSSTSTITDGELVWTSDFSSKIVDQDQVVTLQLSKSFFKNFISIDMEAGYNDYRSKAKFSIPDESNPEPKWEYDYTNASHYMGKMAHVGVTIIPVEGLLAEIKYLDFDEHFKPLFRDSPSYFDEEYADLKGYEAKLTKFYKMFVFSASRKDIQRKSASRYYYNYWRASGEYNYKGFFVIYLHQWRNDFYKYTSYKSAFNTDKNQKTDLDLLKTIIRVTEKSEVSAAYIQEYVDFKKQDQKDLLRTEMELAVWYYLTQTTKLEIKSKATKHGDIVFDNPDNTADNYTEVLLEMKF